MQNMANHSGFTLLELIVAIIIAAIMGSMLVSFTGTALQKSAVPAISMARFYERNQVADNIIADYKADYLHRFSGALQDFADTINSGGTYNSNPYVTVTAQFIEYDANFNENPDADGSEGILRVNVASTSGEGGLTTTFLLTE